MINSNMFNGMFGKIEPGMCRLSMNGEIAVKTSSGYKSYNLKQNRLVNCSSFVFNIGEEYFFIIPTNKAEVGDIILANGKPKCVIKNEEGMLTVVNYETGTVETVLPERHMFMGNTYFYGKIVSMFGKNMFKSKKGTNHIMKYLMVSEMMKGMSGNSDMNAMLPFLMMNGGGMGDMFSGLFDMDEISEEEDVEAEEEE